ncbi:MAG: DUF3034 family protein [Gammaproteobacteria bacterium]|nr:DUF3034 family protein [Gammaproteobacteria bacterium]
MIKPYLYSLVLIINWLSFAPLYASGKILATPGVSQIEGSAGGGLVPWAQLAGYASDSEIAASAFCTRTNVRSFSLGVCGVQLNLYDRVELSYAKQDFQIKPLDLIVEPTIIGLKTRLYGDIVYSSWPQISLGIQRKSLNDGSLALALGAKEDSGTDVYIAMSKLHLAGIFDRNFFWNLTIRHSTANELGILGYGGANEDPINLELSSALFIDQHWAVGLEFRQKPNQLGLNESNWKDVFIAWFPNKHMNLTAAYVDLDTIANIQQQQGWYFSVMGNF